MRLSPTLLSVALYIKAFQHVRVELAESGAFLHFFEFQLFLGFLVLGELEGLVVYFLDMRLQALYFLFFVPVFFHQGDAPLKNFLAAACMAYLNCPWLGILARVAPLKLHQFLHYHFIPIDILGKQLVDGLALEGAALVGVAHGFDLLAYVFLNDLLDRLHHEGIHVTYQQSFRVFHLIFELSMSLLLVFLLSV